MVISLSLFGCANNSNPDTEEENIVEEIGIVSAIKQDERIHVLVIPNITKGQIQDKSEKEILKLAQKNNGSWYGINKGDFKTGQKVKVFYDKNQNVLSSNPPKKGAERIQVLE